MSTKSNQQGTTSYSDMHSWATWLWIFAGILVGAMIGVTIVKDEYYMILMVSLYSTPGGLLGGLITKFLPTGEKWQKKSSSLFLILPVLLVLVSLISMFGITSNIAIGLLFWIPAGILGSAYVVWIPRWIKLLWQKSNGAWWVVVIAIALILINTFGILVIIGVNGAQ